MTPLAIGQLLGDVIGTFMGLDPTRVVLKDENYDAPKDMGTYILIEYEGPRIIGIGSKFQAASVTESIAMASHEQFTIEVISRDSSAMASFPLVLLALASIAATQAAEAAGVAFFRAGEPLDISQIEGSGAQRRYRIPVIVSNLQVSTPPAADIENFPAEEILEEA
jgi:hypothetical protein